MKYLYLFITSRQLSALSGHMDDIKNIIYSVMGRMEKRSPQTESKIERIWRNCLNAKESKHVALNGIKEGVLFVFVDSPMWLYQMNIRKATILKILKQEIPEVKSIRFKIGKIT